MATIEVKVPDIGDFDEVSVIEVLVKAGDKVKAEQSLVTVESDKASMEIPSSAAGTVKELKVKLGDKVKQGSVLIVLEADGAGAVPSPQPSPAGGRGSEASSSASTQAPAVPSPSPASAGEGRGEGVRPQTTEIRVPDIGDFKDVAVIEILVKPGDTIKAEQSLITVESDKASMEIPSSAAGILKELKVKIGDTVNVGDLIGMLEGVGAASPSPQPSPQRGEGASPVAVSAAVSPSPAAGEGRGEGVRTPPTAALPPHEPTAPTANLPHASPSVRKFARELGVPLDEVKGTGPKSRITQEDIQAFTRAVMKGETTTKAVGAKPAAAGGGGEALGLLPWPKVDFAKFGPVERKDMGRIKKISGANLHRNWVMIPHVTNHDDADITDLEAFRVQLNKENEKSGVKLTMLAFLIKACVAALKKFPEFNASLDGDQLVYKQYFNIAFAADTPNGLVVPVIKDADKKGLFQISTEMGELAKKAREGKLGPADMSGACFTISSLGGIGGRYFTPIINAPEVAILGVCKSQMEPVWDGKQFVPKLMLPLSLSWDHRVIDGASAARFNAYLGAILGDFRRTML
ncbi:dihydrolipoyllysine-residue acetyltransferase [Caenimonas sp. SL110]|uniref:dihydrolipoyllysine-residue acetyltransferase n=1 Tax=Caenimonas sp. SL110 TaxID=1450524 RepID=UPI000654B4C9|nr:dihydrolipoyllysine-residue acetyltransferase [Caenimonas sp. SL110]